MAERTGGRVGPGIGIWSPPAADKPAQDSRGPEKVPRSPTVRLWEEEEGSAKEPWGLEEEPLGWLTPTPPRLSSSQPASTPGSRKLKPCLPRFPCS